MKNKEFGKTGEDLAISFLKDKGYDFLSRNYRYKKYEIDLIFQYKNLLIFVEVKTRNNVDFGFPEEQVSSRQEKAIQAAAEQYIFENNWLKDIRFDIIAIDFQEASPRIEHFIDAFY